MATWTRPDGPAGRARRPGDSGLEMTATCSAAALVTAEECYALVGVLIRGWFLDSDKFVVTGATFRRFDVVAPTTSSTERGPLCQTLRHIFL